MGKKPSRAKAASPAANPYVVFVSHATHDKWIAKILCEKIEAIGVSTFRDDRDIEGGDSIPFTIRDRIRSCDEVLVLLTPESCGRDWVIVEIGMAIMVDRRIVPLMYHIDASQIPAIIKDNRGFQLNELDDYLSELKCRVANR